MPSAGDTVRASDTTRYICKGIQTSVQSIPNASFTAVQFNGTDEVDNLGIHDPVTNNSQFVIGLKLGWWQVIGKYATTGTGTAASSRRTRILLNGVTGQNGGYASTPTETVSTGTLTQGGFWTSESTTLVQSTLSTDYVELYAFQDTGGAVNTTVSGDLRSTLICIYLGTGT